MNKYVIAALLFSGVLTNKLVWAADDDNYREKTDWQCTAFDKDQVTWIHKSVYQLVAMSKAYDACKKLSRYPASCKIVKEECEVFVQGVTTVPLWRCTALDQMAKPWISQAYRLRDDAAIAARDKCKLSSAMPDSCYINLLTCRNLSESR